MHIKHVFININFKTEFFGMSLLTKQIFKVSLILFASIIFIIASGGGALDEDDYTGIDVVWVTANDNGEDTKTIDIVWNTDCDNDGAATTDDIEPFTDAFGEVDFNIRDTDAITRVITRYLNGFTFVRPIVFIP